MATNNLPIDYQSTITILTKFLPIMIGTIGKNKYFSLQWQNIGNRSNALVTIGKLVESNI